MYKKFLIIFLLGFSSGLPYALAIGTLQAWFMKSKMPVATISFISFASLPYILRFIWAPLLDKYSLFRIGKRRSWILTMQLLLIVLFNLIGVCNPQTDATLMTLMAFLMAFCSSTLDIGIDAHRTEFLKPEEYGLGASIATLGYRVALFFSAGFALIVGDYYGFMVAYQTISVLMLIGILGVYLTPEPSLENTFKQSYLEPFKDFLRQPQFFYIIAFIFFYKLGESFTTFSSGLTTYFFHSELGFSLATLGFVNKIVGIFSLIAGGILGGVILYRIQLHKALLIFGILQACTNLIYVILAIAPANIYLLVSAVVSDNLAGGMLATGLLAFLMSIVNKKYTAAQFSMLAALFTLPNMIVFPLGSWLLKYFSWVNVYEISVILSLVFIPLLMKLSKNKTNLVASV